jgi:hypothetical protein
MQGIRGDSGNSLDMNYSVEVQKQLIVFHFRHFWRKIDLRCLSCSAGRQEHENIFLKFFRPRNVHERSLQNLKFQ